MPASEYVPSNSMDSKDYLPLGCFIRPCVRRTVEGIETDDVEDQVFLVRFLNRYSLQLCTSSE